MHRWFVGFVGGEGLARLCGGAAAAAALDPPQQQQGGHGRVRSLWPEGRRGRRTHAGLYHEATARGPTKASTRRRIDAAAWSVVTDARRGGRLSLLMQPAGDVGPAGGDDRGGVVIRRTTMDISFVS